MTNKEALKSLCNHCEKLSIRDGFIGCPFRNISNDYCEEFETIEKDLEVLEILKDHLVTSDKYIMICVHKDAKDFEKVNEWLEDDK